VVFRDAVRRYGGGVRRFLRGLGWRRRSGIFDRLRLLGIAAYRGNDRRRGGERRGSKLSWDVVLQGVVRRYGVGRRFPHGVRNFGGLRLLGIAARRRNDRRRRGDRRRGGSDRLRDVVLRDVVRRDGGGRRFLRGVWSRRRSGIFGGLRLTRKRGLSRCNRWRKRRDIPRSCNAWFRGPHFRGVRSKGV
jgi:hypothetical protein